jgi:hypothetical protein
VVRDLHPHVGHTAGLVYKAIEKSGKPMSVLTLCLHLKLWPWEVMTALGWLSREGKVKLWKNVFALMAALN